MKVKLPERIGYTLERIGLLKRKIGSGDLPSEGRSSVPSYKTFETLMRAYVGDYIAPKIPFALTEAIERAAIYNADLSDAVSKFRSLANTGHRVVMEGPEQRVESAIDILNETAYRIYQRSAGMDGLVNHLLDQVAITGAVCAEDVVDLSRMEIEEVAIVPTTTIRFRYEEGHLVPYQKTSSFDRAQDLVKLNENTFCMFAAQVWRDSPYPKSPFTAALEPLILQRACMQNIEYILRKIGLLGLVHVALNIPTKKPGEEGSAYESRKQAYLNQAVKAFEQNFRQGLMITYKDFDINHSNITADARGAKDIFQVVEEQMASGLNIDPAMLGRSYSTTETYAGVVYASLAKDASIRQRLVRRRIERTYRLELQLKGIEIEDLAVPFEKIPARDPQAEAQAEATRITSIITKAEKGMIDPDVAAQEAGYDSWFDEERLYSQAGGGLPFGFVKPRSRKFSFRFDKASNRYQFERERIIVGTWPQPPRDAFANESRPVSLQSQDDEALSRLEEAIRNYLGAVKSQLNKAQETAVESVIDFLQSSKADDFADAEAFAKAAFEKISLEYRAVMESKESREAIAATVGELYAAFKVSDLTSWEKASLQFTIGGWDRRTMAWMGEVDHFFFSKFINNETMVKPVTGFLKEQFTEKGEGLFGRMDPDVVAKFREVFDDKLKDLADHQAKNIINHSVQRQRNWAHGQQMREAEVEEAKVVAVLDDSTSDICLEMNGTIIPVGKAMEGLDSILELKPDEYLEHLESTDPEDYKSDNIENLAGSGDGWPPYHPGPCRTRVIAQIK